MTAPADTTPFDDLAPTPVEELGLETTQDDKEDEGDEGEGGQGSDGKSGGGGKKPPVNVSLKELDEEDLSSYDSERLIEKLKMLVWAPFSIMVPGASAFESEHDLKRKLFLGQLGMITDQIDPHDIADPDFINRLEQRNQQRQKEYGIDVISAAGSSAALGGAIASLQEVPQEKQQKQQIKQDAKFQAQQPKEASNDAQTEADDKRPDAEQKARLEEQQRLNARVEVAPEAEENSFAAEKDRNDMGAEPAKKQDGLTFGEMVELVSPHRTETVFDDQAESKGLSSMNEIAGIFNVIAQQTEYNAPEQRVDFKFADPAPKVASIASPMGGV